MISESQTATFPHVYCSQCGRDFGPGTHGFSHCCDHQTAQLAKSWSLLPSLASLDHHFALWFEGAATRDDETLGELTGIAIKARKIAGRNITTRIQNDPET